MKAPNPNYWKDKTVLVTGASRGLGRILAVEFARQGANVVVTARSNEALQETAEAVRSVGREPLTVAADITRDEDVRRLIEAAIARFDRLDVLVNNAGRSMRRSALETTADEFREVMEINLIAAARCTQAAMPYLLAQRGHLVNIGSLSSKVAARFYGAYPASKFALAAYSQQLRLELGSQGLHVLLVCPGPIRRDEASGIPASDFNRVPEEARKPGGGAKTRLLDPQLLAQEILVACERRQLELVRPRKAKVLFVLLAISTRWGDWLLRRWTT